MAQMILHDFKTFMQQDYGTLSLGIKPSGRPHIGSVATFIAAFEYVANNPAAVINLQIMDLDFDSQRGNAFTPFIHQTEESGLSVREALHKELDEIVDVMGAIYQSDVAQRVQTTYFSEFLLMPATLDKFLSIFTDKEKTSAMNMALFDQKFLKRVPVSGICPNCHTSTAGLATRSIEASDLALMERTVDFLKANTINLDSVVLEQRLQETTKKIEAFNSRLRSINENNAGGPQYVLRSECRNKACSVESYDFDMRLGMYNIHYLVDPLRDEIFAPNGNVVHIFGGDYAKPHGAKRIPKAERIRNALIAVGSMNQDFFIGPLINFRGEKMGKSGIAVPFLQLTYKNQRSVVEYLRELYLQGSREIAYEQILKRVR